MISRPPRTLMRGAMPAASPAPTRGRLSAACGRAPCKVRVATPTGRAADASDRSPSSLLLWYLGLIPHWTGARPRLERQLLLRTHEWIVDRVLAPGATVDAAVSDLEPDGPLERALTELVPADETGSRRQFVRVVVAHLRHALLQPVTRRNEAWLRWLFLIPYS